MNFRRTLFLLVLFASIMVMVACNAAPVEAPTSSAGSGSLPTATLPTSYPAPVSGPTVGVAYPSVGQLPTSTPPGYPAGPTATPEVIQSPQTVTLEDSGKMIMMKVGERFLLNLGMDVYQWSINIDDQTVLSRVKNVMTIKGSQGLFEALQPGHATLTATGDPLCASEVPACKMPSRLFTIYIIVQTN